MYKILLFYKKNLKRAKSIMTKFSSVNIARAGITANPLEMYNPVSLTTVPNDTLVKHGERMFVGGDTDTIEYDFFTKVVNSSVENPLKIYKQEVDLGALPNPSTGWTEVTDQTIIDKLKTQNELPITNTNTGTRQATWNGKTLVVQSASQPAVRDDFAGKVMGSLVANPNITYYSFTSTLQNPSNITGFTSTGLKEFDLQSFYDSISSLNGSPLTVFNTNIAGKIPQQLFSFNIIAMLEQKYGTLPCASDLASKVAWAKANLKTISGVWYGYGLANGINKAYLDIFNNSIPNWSGSPVTHNYSTPTILARSTTATTVVIDNNGFVHFLAYTDAYSTSTATIYTDYVSLDLQLKDIAGYDTLIDQNPRRDSGMANIVLLEKIYANKMTDFVGKVSGSTVENPNKYRWGNGLTLNSPLSVDGATIGEMSGTNYSKIVSIDGTSSSVSISTTSNIAQALFSFDLIRAYEDVNGAIPNCSTVVDKVAWLKLNITNFICSWTGYGSCPTGYKASLSIFDVGGSSWVGTLTNNASTPTLITKSTAFVGGIDNNGFVHFLASTDPSDGTTPSTIYTDYVKLDITYKNSNNSIEYFTNNSIEIDVYTVNKASAYLVECDMSAIAAALGGNSALKSVVKSFNADVWTVGNGNNAGSVGNGVVVRNWYEPTLVWSSTNPNYNTNTSSVITKTTINSPDNSQSVGRITSSNKYYILIYAQYPASATISSSISLDYLKLTVQLSRVPDTVASIPVNLKPYWAMVVKGFSPNWDSSRSGINNRVFSFYTDDSNRWTLLRNFTGQFNFSKIKTGITYGVTSSVQTFSKNQVYNFLVGQNSSGMFMYLLKNNGTVEKLTNTDVNMLNGQILLHILNQANINQADSFLDNLTLIDLTNKPSGFTDGEAEIILRGIPVPSSDEMVVNGDFSSGGTGWTVASGTWDFSNNIASLTVSDSTSWRTVQQDINVLPNSTYIITGTSNNGRIAIDGFPSTGTTPTQSDLVNKTCTGIENVNITFITGANTFRARIKIDNASKGNGTFTFDNISLKYVKPNNAITMENPELFDINKVSLHVNASRSNGVITLNASANFQECTITIPVLPNNRYEFKNTVTGGSYYIHVLERYNNIPITNRYTFNNGVFITSDKTNSIKFVIGNNTTGTFTYSNISLKRKD